jgi:hypothetical protein
MPMIGKGQKPKYKLLRVLPFLLPALLTLACERDTKVSIDGKVPPTFHMIGSGQIVFFVVTEIAPDNQKLAPAQRDSRKDTVLWKIAPDNLSSNDKNITQLPDIIYGLVPKGFLQKTPETGVPPSLVEGRVYQAGGPAVDAHGGFVWFTIRDGKSVQVEEPSGS